MEAFLSRIIKVENTYKQRLLLQKSIVQAIRELTTQKDVNETTRDLAAYIVLSLQAIARTIDPTVEAWEKRGYWVKADRFRLDWSWTDKLSQNLKESLVKGDWQNVATIIAQVAEKLKRVELPKRNRLGAPWIGAWDKMK